MFLQTGRRPEARLEISIILKDGEPEDGEETFRFIYGASYTCGYMGDRKKLFIGGIK